ncbi:MAG TPA: Uma2 family endonuclease [Thermoanaerobaculia bacterium]|jgi:Uma2 family endonuclease|nr:Uma2 family endonuclease [Thermoanaerobaculia bacterium]
MALHDLARKLTYEDYVLIPDDGQRHEIIDGEHYVTAAPFLSHQRLAFLLTLRVGGFVETNRLGLFFFAPADVLLSAYDVVQPDMFFISSERAAIAGLKNVQGAPDLVIEILSRSTHRLDGGAKLQAYERSGVREYWMFDLFKRGVQPWERTDEGLRPKPFLSAAAGDVLASPLLPGFELPLAELFEHGFSR